LSQYIYLARQPIFDTNGLCIAYEVFYRKQKNSIGADIKDGTNATAHVMINLMNNIGFELMLEDKQCFININEEILFSDALFSLPKEKFIFEILEFVTISEAVITRVQELYTLGYRFALDDFCCKIQDMKLFKNIFPFIDVVKVDLLETHDLSLEEMGVFFKPYSFTLLAEKVETHEMYEHCKQVGFEQFQGYFFEKPTIVEGKKLEPNIIDTIDIINTLLNTDNIEIITEKFSFYPEVTFNLLRYINSAEFSFCGEITSVRQIINLLGLVRLRSWFGLFLYTNNMDKAFGQSIIKSARFRAKMMKELTIIHKKPELAEEAFLSGSLSLIDVYLETSMESLMGKIALSNSINEALLKREGYFGKLLNIVENLERTDDLESLIVAISQKLRISSDELYSLYCKANDFTAIQKS
jgi:EAL and modified HD-GYP domain-containing signal transduction protein